MSRRLQPRERSSHFDSRLKRPQGRSLPPLDLPIGAMSADGAALLAAAVSAAIRAKAPRRTVQAVAAAVTGVLTRPACATPAAERRETAKPDNLNSKKLDANEVSAETLLAALRASRRAQRRRKKERRRASKKVSAAATAPGNTAGDEAETADLGAKPMDTSEAAATGENGGGQSRPDAALATSTARALPLTPPPRRATARSEDEDFEQAPRMQLTPENLRAHDSLLAPAEAPASTGSPSRLPDGHSFLGLSSSAGSRPPPLPLPWVTASPPGKGRRKRRKQPGQQ